MKEVNLCYSYELDCAQTTGKVPLKMRGFTVKTPCWNQKQATLILAVYPPSQCL